MKNVAFPEYNEPVARFVHCKTPEDIIAEVGTLKNKTIALDTESYYDADNSGVIRFINGSKNNVPFGVSITLEVDGEYKSYWVTERGIPKLKPLLEDSSVQKILHNSKFDMHMLKNIGIDLNGYIWDTMIMIHLIDEEHMCKMPDGKLKMSKALKNLAFHYLGEDGHKYEALVDEVRRVLALNSERVKNDVSYKEACDAAPDIMKDYACSDTEFTYKLWKMFLKVISAQELEKAYEVDINATRAVFEIERTGIAVDMEYYNKLEAELAAQAIEITDKISTIIPIELNIRSAADLVKGFEGLGVEWLWFTEKGELQTNDKVLQQFKEGCPGELAELVLQYRDVTKMKDTFIAQIKEYVQNDRVHADFNICPKDNSEGGTVTGRLSSNSPNLQNIPKDDDRIRKGFISTNGFFLLELDYDQQEYRLLGHYSEDRAFSEIIRAGKDVHAGAAELLYGLSHEDALLKPNRDRGKKMNFSMVYGLGLAQLAANLGYKINVATYNLGNAILRKLNIKPWEVPHKDDLMVRLQSDEDKKIMEYYFSDEAKIAIASAKGVKEKYFAQFPDIGVFIKDCTNAAKRRGWVKTWTGRKRHFKNPSQEAYKAPNAVIQGGCGDIIKVKLAQVNEMLKPYKSRMVNTVHDSVLFEIAYGEEYLIPHIVTALEDLPFRVPITCGIEFSKTSWADLKKVKDIREVV